MAFPTVVARTSSEQSTDASSFTVGLGAPSAGELLVVFVAVDANSTTDINFYHIDEGVSGRQWFLASKVWSNNAVTGIVAIKLAEGSDALKIVFGDGAAQQASAIAFRISGHGSYAAVASSLGSSSNGDPPAASITGAAQDCLFIAALCTDGQTLASAAPSGYANLTTKIATNTTGASVSVADITSNATSDNPGTFTNTPEQWAAFTVAIPELAITTNARTTQESIESVSVGDRNAVVTQAAVEVVSSFANHMVTTQVALEVLTPQTQYLYATQVALEVLSGDPWPSLSNPNKYRQIQIAC